MMDSPFARLALLISRVFHVGQPHEYSIFDHQNQHNSKDLYDMLRLLLFFSEIHTIPKSFYETIGLLTNFGSLAKGCGRKTMSLELSESFRQDSPARNWTTDSL
jgi:hypothetical protein